MTENEHQMASDGFHTTSYGSTKENTHNVLESV